MNPIAWVRRWTGLAGAQHRGAWRRARVPLRPGLVSTIVPVYNRSLLLREAIESVLSQSYRSFEIIIVDDGSTDDTADVCDQLARAHSVIRVIHKRHEGRAGLARETGRAAAHGEYLQYLDSDDLIAPDKYARLVQALTDHPECDIAYSYTRRYVRGSAPRNVPMGLSGETVDWMDPPFLHGRLWQTSTPLYRRTAGDHAGPWSDLAFWEDIHYDMRMASRRPRLHHCREFLTDFRDHDLGRLSRSSLYDTPELFPEAVRGCQLIYRSAHHLRPDHAALRIFLEDVSLLARRCVEFGLPHQERALRAIVKDGSRGQFDDALGATTLHASLEPSQQRILAAPGQGLVLALAVKNTSTVTFRSGEFPFALTYRVLSREGAVIEPHHPRRVFDVPLPPGAQRTIHLEIHAPEAPGDYVVEFDMLWEPVATFRDHGSPTPSVDLLVGAAPRTALAGR